MPALVRDSNVATRVDCAGAKASKAGAIVAGKTNVPVMRPEAVMPTAAFTSLSLTIDPLARPARPVEHCDLAANRL